MRCRDCRTDGGRAWHKSSCVGSYRKFLFPKQHHNTINTPTTSHTVRSCACIHMNYPSVTSFGICLLSCLGGSVGGVLD